MLSTQAACGQVKRAVSWRPCSGQQRGGLATHQRASCRAPDTVQAGCCQGHLAVEPRAWGGRWLDLQIKLQTL